jgi:hypothetical protein
VRPAEQEVYKNAHVIGDPHSGPKSYVSFQDYFEAEVKQPFETWAELEQTYHFVTTYAPHLFERPCSEANGARVQARMMTGVQVTTGKVRPRGGDQKSEQRKSIGKFPIDPQAQRAATSGISDRTQRKLDRLARDYPEHFTRVQRKRENN